MPMGLQTCYTRFELSACTNLQRNTRSVGVEVYACSYDTRCTRTDLLPRARMTAEHLP